MRRGRQPPKTVNQRESPGVSPDFNKRLAAVLADPMNKRRLGGLLKAGGYRVRAFTEESQLLAFLKDWIPDVVLMDVRFAGGNYQKGRDLVRKIRKLNIERGNPWFPVLVCLSSLRHPVQEEELRRLGAEVAWLSAPTEVILGRIEYGLHLARSAAHNTPHFRIIFENPDGSWELTEASVLRGVVLDENHGGECPVPLTFTPLLIFVYLLLRSNLPQDINDMREGLNSIPFYSSGTENRIFTYDSIKMELSRIRKCLERFLAEHGFSFSKVWLEGSVDGDERTTGIRIKAKYEIDVRKNETVLAHGFKL